MNYGEKYQYFIFIINLFCFLFIKVILKKEALNIKLRHQNKLLTATFSISLFLTISVNFITEF